MLSDFISNLNPYQPISGKFDIRLDANESFIPLPTDMLDNFKDSLSQIDFNRYPDPYASKTSSAFANFFHISSDYVTASNGSDECISIILSTFLSSGEKLLVTSPDFSMYKFYAQLYGIDVLDLPKNPDMTIDVYKLIKVAKNAKMVMFSNPCNPTSVGLDLEDVLFLLRNINGVVVIDEAYMDFWSQSQSVMNYVGQFDNLIVLKTCSKAFGLAAARMGFAIAGQELTRTLRAVKSPYNTNSLSQKLVETLLSKPHIVRKHLSTICSSRDNLLEIMTGVAKKIGGTVFPTVTNFIYWELPSENEAEYVYKVLQDNSIAVRKMNKAIRITAGQIQEHARLLDVFEKYYRKESNNE